MVTVGLAAALRTERHAYAVDLVLREVLGLEWDWVEEGGDVTVAPGGLLAGRDVMVAPPTGTWKDWTLPFAMEGRVDVFAFAFWMVTRMEEWTESGRDEHGRFKGGASWAARAGVLEVPVVEVVVRAWAVAEGLPDPPPRRATWYATIDVDNALAYRGKPAWRVLAGFGRDAVERNWGRMRERWNVMSGRTRDPFDTYAELLDLHAEAGVEGVFFFLMADRGPHDQGLPHTSKGLAEAIRLVATRAKVGIHPGYASHGQAERIHGEMMRLNRVLGREVEHARQHYLLHDARRAWPALVAAGVREDWSMGFADQIGFRAGMARPFQAYDLAAECPLPLRVHPVLAMEATLGRYMGLAAGPETLERVWRCAQAAWDVGGDVVTIWHNETIAGRGEWQPWRQFYQTLILDRPASLR